MRRFLMPALVLATTYLGACRSVDQNPGDDSEVKSLAANPSGRNIALITTGLNKDVDDAADSLVQTERLRKFLKMITGSAPFEIREFQEATKDELLKYTVDAARDVGKDGTLFWYVGTHGWTDGFEMKSGRVHAADLEDALRQGRQGKAKMKRLFMIFDYCGSGGTVNELNLTQEVPQAGPETFAPILNELADRLGRDDGLALADAAPVPGSPAAPFYDQAVFLSPTSPTQETIGETMTLSMLNVVKEAKVSRPNITIGQFLTSTAKLVSKQKTEDFFGDADEDFVLAKQHMVFRALPNEQVLSALLLKP